MSLRDIHVLGFNNIYFHYLVSLSYLTLESDDLIIEYNSSIKNK